MRWSSDMNSLDVHFGGKVVVLGGDFRQILTVIRGGSRADIVMATINSSILWKYCKVLRLSKNMILLSHVPSDKVNEVMEFSKWVLDVGDGKVGVDDDGVSVVEIPDNLLVLSSIEHVKSLVDLIYPNLSSNFSNPFFFEGRAIMTPKLEVVEEINQYVLSLVEGSSVEYISSDSICKIDEDINFDCEWITTEFLNDIRCSGIPNHRLILKIGVPIMLLRNIDQAAGLCNCTRLIVTFLGKNVIAGRVVSGNKVGDIVYIPRITMVPSDIGLPFKFQRRQFPVMMCFCMTINKSQGQSLSHVGLFLSKGVFSHGQLYVALSRVKSKDGLKVLILDDNGKLCSRTNNVVFQEVFQKI